MDSPNLINPWLVAIFNPLIMPPKDWMGNLLNDYINVWARFNEENILTIEDHLTTFQEYMDNFYVEKDDVFFGTFAQSLEGEAKKWLTNLKIVLLGIGGNSMNFFYRGGDLRIIIDVILLSLIP